MCVCNLIIDFLCAIRLDAGCCFFLPTNHHQRRSRYFVLETVPGLRKFVFVQKQYSLFFKHIDASEREAFVPMPLESIDAGLFLRAKHAEGFVFVYGCFGLCLCFHFACCACPGGFAIDLQVHNGFFLLSRSVSYSISYAATWPCSKRQKLKIFELGFALKLLKTRSGRGKREALVTWLSPLLRLRCWKWWHENILA